MRHTLWILLLLVAGPGCFLNPFVSKDKALPKLPPAPVTADQVNTRNAHEMSVQMADELDYEELHPTLN